MELELDTLETLSTNRNHFRHIIASLSKHQLGTPAKALAQGFVQIDPWCPASKGDWIQAERVEEVLEAIREREDALAREMVRAQELAAQREAEKPRRETREEARARREAEQFRKAEDARKAEIHRRMAKVQALGIQVPESHRVAFLHNLEFFTAATFASRAKLLRAAEESLEAAAWKIRREEAKQAKFDAEMESGMAEYEALGRAFERAFDNRTPEARLFESLPPLGFI